MTTYDDNEGQPATTPYFPYYIDEDMVTSFLATVEGGLSIAEKVSQTIATAKQRNLSGAVGVSANVPFIAKGDGSGTAGRSSESASEEIWEIERHHTLISLFNLLRDQLLDHGIVRSMRDDPEAHVEVGDIVEFDGSIRNNAFAELKELWETYLLMRPVLDNAGVAEKATPTRRSSKNPQIPKHTRKPSKPASQEEEMVQLIVDMSSKGLESSGLLDVHIDTGHRVYSSVVLTLRAEHAPAQSIAFSNGSKCTVIGKITGISDEDTAIKMYRRSGLRFFPIDLMEEVFKPLYDLPNLEVDLDMVGVPGPAIQVLPLAIFV